MFRDLRRALRLSLPELASRLGTRIEVINTLERGDLTRLPPWPETVRVVVAFTGLAKIDPRPILGIMGQRMTSAAILTHPKVPALAKLRSLAGSVVAARMGPAAATMRSLGAKAARASATARAKHHGGRLRAKALLALAAAGLLGAAQFTRDSDFPGNLAILSPPLSRLMRGAQDFVRMQAAPIRDGHKWIEVDDPRTRRSDRLDSSHL